VKTDVTLEILLEAPTGNGQLAQRAQELKAALKRAGLKADLCVRGQAESLPDARSLDLPAGSTRHALLLAAASSSQAEALLYWPAEQAPDAQTLRDLALSLGQADGVLAPRGRIPAVIAGLQQTLGLDPAFDLGAPLLLRCSSIKTAGQGLGPGDPLIALQLLRGLVHAEGGLHLLPHGEAPLSLLDAMGLSGAWLRALSRRGEAMGVGALLIAGGIAFPKPALLSLLSFGFGFLITAYAFGKSE